MRAMRFESAGDHRLEKSVDRIEIDGYNTALGSSKVSEPTCRATMKTDARGDTGLSQGGDRMRSWMKSGGIALALLPVVLFASTQPVEAG